MHLLRNSQNNVPHINATLLAILHAYQCKIATLCKHNALSLLLRRTEMLSVLSTFRRQCIASVCFVTVWVSISRSRKLRLMVQALMCWLFILTASWSIWTDVLNRFWRCAKAIWLSCARAVTRCHPGGCLSLTKAVTSFPFTTNSF